MMKPNRIETLLGVIGSLLLFFCIKKVKETEKDRLNYFLCVLKQHVIFGILIIANIINISFVAFTNIGDKLTFKGGLVESSGFVACVLLGLIVIFGHEFIDNSTTVFIKGFCYAVLWILSSLVMLDGANETVEIMIVKYIISCTYIIIACIVPYILDPIMKKIEDIKYLL